jgi:hypothetical protein
MILVYVLVYVHARCTCDHHNIELPDGGDIFDCRTGNMTWFRHERIVSDVRAMLAQAGLPSIPNPELQWEGGERPDILVYMNPNTNAASLIDVSVTRPLSASFIRRVIQHGAGAAAALREQEKHHKYDALAAPLGHVVVPFVLEQSGHFGREALDLIHRAAVPYEQSHHGSSYSRSSFTRYWTRRISVTNQKWSAQKLLKHVSAIRFKHHARHGQAPHPVPPILPPQAHA